MRPGILFRSATILTMGSLIEALAAFGSQLVIARKLGPEAFGRFATSSAIVGLIFAIGTLRLAQLIVRASHDQLKEHQGVLLSALVWETLGCSIFGAAWVAFDPHASALDFLLVFSAALQHWISGNRSVVERSLVFHRIGIAETFSTLIGHAAALFLVLIGGGIAALYAREAVSAIARLIGMVLANALTFMPIHKVAKHQWVSLFKQSRGIWLDGLLEGAFQRMTVLIASGLVGLRGAGYFFFAQRLAGVPQQLMGPVVTRMSGPWFSALKGMERLRLLRRMLTLSSIILLLGSCFVFWAAKPVIPWAFGEQWRDAIPVFQALCGMIVFLSLTEILKTYLMVNHYARGILFGRLAQFLGFAIVLLVFWLSGVGITPVVIAIGISCAFLSSFAVMVNLAR